MEHGVKAHDLQHPGRHDIYRVEQWSSIHPGCGYNTPQVDDVSKEDRKSREKHCKTNTKTSQEQQSNWG